MKVVSPGAAANVAQLGTPACNQRGIWSGLGLGPDGATPTRYRGCSAPCLSVERSDPASCLPPKQGGSGNLSPILRSALVLQRSISTCCLVFCAVPSLQLGAERSYERQVDCAFKPSGGSTHSRCRWTFRRLGQASSRAWWIMARLERADHSGDKWRKPS